MATSEKQSPGSALLTACERWTLRSGFSDKGLDVCPYYEQLAAELGDDLEGQGLDGALSLHFADQVHSMDAGDLVNHQRAGYLEAAHEMAGFLRRLLAYRPWPTDVARHLERERDELLARVARGPYVPLYSDAAAPGSGGDTTEAVATGQATAKVAAAPSKGESPESPESPEAPRRDGHILVSTVDGMLDDACDIGMADKALVQWMRERMR